MSVCIQYSRPASGQNDSEIFGFDVAVRNFLLAYFRHSTENQFICRPTDLSSFEHFKQMATAGGVDASRIIGLDPRSPETNLQSVSCLFRPDPLTVDLIWRRQQMREPGYATCGLVHTMSGERIAKAVADLCLAPSDQTDALICPSRAIRDAVQNLWEIHSEYLNFRFGSSFRCPVKTPIIPLGIDTADFALRMSEEKRRTIRTTIGIADDETVILFVGRLSFATKAHPLPMFMAAERAALRTGRKVRLLMYGYFKPSDMEEPFRKLAKEQCPHVEVTFILNDDPRFPEGIWAAADIFTSLSDNVQESFGLTPLEAMACGLPSVISDWDGYREGVRNGSDGFLIPVTTPPASAGMAIARRYFNEDNYGVALSGAAQSTAVDIEWCAQSYAVLIENSDLRHTFGRNAKQRAQDVFDWKIVIGAYDDLWRELSRERVSNASKKGVPDGWQAVHPGYPNPWKMFESFPSTHLAPSDVMVIAMDKIEVDAIIRNDMNYFVPDLLLAKDQMVEMIGIIRGAETVRISNILSAFPRESHDLIWRCLGWMLKHGVCRMQRST